MTIKKLFAASAVALALAACGESDKPMPPALACHAGPYQMEDGRVMGLIERAEDEFRKFFETGETGSAHRVTGDPYMTGPLAAISPAIGVPFACPPGFRRRQSANRRQKPFHRMAHPV